jgi:3',5'-cyclic AMP phosphodiesterase CpdA
MDPAGRIARLARALDEAKQSGADHVVISGDLTEMGTPAQYDVFAEVLHDAALDPTRVTLVPGNHDAYTSPDGWQRALEGPLAAFAPSSAGAGPRAAGKIVERGGAVMLPIDTSRHQSVILSGGEVDRDTADALERRLGDPGLREKAVVVVQHHPPFAHAARAWQWIDGLRGGSHLTDLLARHPRVQVLHGHMHRLVDRVVGGLGKCRVFGAPAVVEDTPGRARIRLYEVEGTELCPTGLSEIQPFGGLGAGTGTARKVGSLGLRVPSPG